MEKSLGPCFSMAPLFLVLGIVLLPQAFSGHDYGEALKKSFLFFEAQRSGYLPSDQRITWRGNSGLNDGIEVDLVGGYYDAGDNVKFGLPMAFTVTMMSWSIIEYWKPMANIGELGHALEAVKWGTDYLIKAHPEPNVLYGEVGDGNTDHKCWQRPEDMTTSRKAYKIDKNNPGSDLAGETAAAMAAASIVFRRYNSSYAAELREHAIELFHFADTYRGKYDDSITVAQPYYISVSGYADELLWAAAWLYKATGNDSYLTYLSVNGDALRGTVSAMTEFGWDVKYAGVQTLVAKFLMKRKAGKYTTVLEKYREKAENFMCSCLGNATTNVQKTTGGLIFVQNWNNMQFVTSASFLMTVYSDYLASAGQSLSCENGNVAPEDLLSFAKRQVDYILGDNPRLTSYMVGYGKKYPRQVHHRGASIVSYKVHSSLVSCSEGFNTWYYRNANNPNVLQGAIVGGPDANDNFADKRDNYVQTEPTTYNTASLLGVLARLNAAHAGNNQHLPASSNNPVVVQNKVTSSWRLNGKTYYRYTTKITNRSSKNVINLKLSISNLYGPLWGLTKHDKSDNNYFLPSWINSLQAGKSIKFVYIHSAAPATVSVSSFTLT